MAKYVWRDGRFIDKETGRPAPAPKWNSIQAPQIMPDIKAYRSPIDGRVIEGRIARREDLKRNDCREVDPSEHSGEYTGVKADKYRQNDWKAARKRHGHV